MNLRKTPFFGSGALLALAAVPWLQAPPALAQGAASQNYFWSGGRKVPLSASSWVGVRVAPNASGAVTRGLQSEGALDATRAALRFNSMNIMVLPLSAKASAAQKNALRGRLDASASVKDTVQTFSVTGDANALPYVATGEIAVSFRSSASSPGVQKILAKYGAKVLRSLGPIAPNAVLLGTSKGNSLELANVLYESGLTNFSHPHFLMPMEKRGAIGGGAMKAARKIAQNGQSQLSKAGNGLAPLATVNDPLYPLQWHLNNTGQGGGKPGADVRIQDAWNISKGSPNITVAIMDDSVDVSHEDFGPDKLVPGYDFLDNDTDPSPVEIDDDHGTACAGVAVGTGDNALGISGAAPGSKLMPIRMLGRLTSDIGIADAFRFATTNGADIISNSWGPVFSGVPLPDVIKASIDFATTTGRGGKGSVVLFAAGNSRRNSDLDGYAAYERVINVAATTNEDLRADYSNSGRTLDVSAPSSGGSLGIVTTDRMGNLGYTIGNYTPDRGNESFGGTSSACPLVAGVAALLLSVEPNLNYIEVRQRLEQTADKIDLTGGAYDSRGQSNFYGYGRINAGRALLGRPPKTEVTAPLDNSAVGGTAVSVRARTSNDARVQRMVFDARPVYGRGTRDNINVAIPDFNFEGITSELVLSGTARRLLSTATVSLQINHSFIGDLQVVLISPNGTREVVYDHEGGGASSLSLTKILPLIVRDTAGTYKLQVIDDVQVDTGTLVSWGLTIGGPYTTIGTQEAAAHRIGTEWGVTWNTARLASGEYEVRATAITDQLGTFSDTNTGIRVSGVEEPRFTVSGKVIDAAGRPVAGVLITRGDQNVRTNAQGIYIFSTPVAAGQYEVRASLTSAVFEPSLRRVLVTDGNVDNANFTLTVRDTIVPTVRISSPLTTNQIVASLRSVTGVAEDNRGGSGISKVTGILYRYGNAARVAGFYTTGNVFEANPATALRERLAATVIATGGARATYTFALPGLDDGRYRVTIQSYDRANNRSAPQFIEFIIDRTAPALRLARPVNNGVYNVGTVTVAEGTATDANGVATLTAQFYRFANGTTPAGYWTGSGDRYSATPREITIPVANSFRFALPANLPAGRYLLRFTAIDRAANRSQVQATFTLRDSTTRTTLAENGASSASASVSSVVLNFASALPNATNGFVLSINGVQIEAESVGIVGNRLTLGLPQGAAQSGDKIVVSWPNLRDAGGRKLAAGSQNLTVR